MDRQTKYTLQVEMDFFDHYWRDDWVDWHEKYANGSREPVIRQLRVPRTRFVPRRADRPPEGPRLNARNNRISLRGYRNSQTYRAYLNRVAGGEYGVVNFTQPLGLKLRKILGKGGEGVACLFRLSQKDGSERDIVVKAALGKAAMTREMANMRVRIILSASSYLDT